MEAQNWWHAAILSVGVAAGVASYRPHRLLLPHQPVITVVRVLLHHLRTDIRRGRPIKRVIPLVQRGATGDGLDQPGCAQTSRLLAGQEDPAHLVVW
jgi:hypothetical protein